jgi:hypothetical protein
MCPRSVQISVNHLLIVVALVALNCGGFDQSTALSRRSTAVTRFSRCRGTTALKMALFCRCRL